MEKVILIVLFLYLIFFPFGQLTRLPVQLSEVNLYLTDILVGLLALFWWGSRFWKKRKMEWPPLGKPIFLFASIAGLSLLFNSPLLSSREVIVAGLYLARWLAYAGLYFIVFDLQKRFKFLKWNSRLRSLLVIGVAMALFGLVQYFLWPNLKALEVLEWDPHFYRVAGTFLDPGFTGLILVLTLILLVVLGWRAKKKAGWYLIGFLVYLALAFTYSRSAYLAYLISMSLIAYVKKSPRFFLVVLMIGLLTVLIIPRPAGEGGKLSRWYTIENRLQNYRQSLEIAWDHPLLGIGFNAYRYAQRDYGFLAEDEWEISHAGAGADSSFLFVLATTGIIGLLAYLWFWWKMIQTKNLIILASLTALFVHSFFLNSLFYPWTMAWLWLLLACRTKRNSGF